MPYCTNTPLLTRPTKFSYINLEIYKRHFLCTLMKKIIKHLAENSYSVFNGVWRRTIEYTKTHFLHQMFYFFIIKICEKYNQSVQDFFSQTFVCFTKLGLQTGKNSKKPQK